MSEEDLKSYPWKTSYSDDADNILFDFFVPALERSIRYDRLAGYYSSSVLSAAAQGVTRLIANGGKMRLVVGVQLMPDDVEAIKQGLSEREVIERVLDRELPKLEDFRQRRNASFGLDGRQWFS